jgi:hypothetical protein
MKTIAQLLAVLALAMAVVAAWVFGAGDRQTFVPPPDAVAEGFVRQLASRRYDRVDSYLSRSHRITAAELRWRCDPLWRYSGQVNHVDAELVARDAERARAVARVSGDVAEARFVVELTREHGLWKVGGFSTHPPSFAEAGR